MSAEHDLRPESFPDGPIRPTPEMVRSAADGECTSDDPALGRSAEAIDFERRLRVAVGRVMGGEHAPAELDRRVRQAMAAEGRPEATSAATPELRLAGSAAAPLAAPPAAASAARRWFDAPKRANAAAVAAVLALVLGSIGFGIVMPSISQWGPASADRFIEQAAGFAAREHTRCSDESVLDGKLVSHGADLAEARVFLARHLNRSPDRIRIPDFSDRGYEFVGVAPCRVPGGLPSAHAVWRSTTPEAGGRRALLSAFVTLDREQFEVREAEAARIRVGGVPLPDGDECHRTVQVTRGDGMALLVVCCDDGALEECTRRVASEMASGSRVNRRGGN